MSSHKKMSPKSTGAATDLAFALEAVKKGAIVSEPIGDDHPYDLVLDVDGRFLRIQVKTATQKPKYPNAHSVNTTRRIVTPGRGGKLTTKSVPYAKGEIDFIVTQAGVFWYFLGDAHRLPGVVVVYPGKTPTGGRYIHCASHDKWSLLGP